MTQGTNSQEELNKIRDRIIDAANNGHTEAINDMNYFDKPLSRLIEAREQAAMEGVLEEVETSILESISLDLSYYVILDTALKFIQSKRQSLNEKEKTI